MKVFRFSLDKILTWRRLLKEQELAKLNKLIADREHLDRQRTTLQQMRASTETELVSSRTFEATYVATFPEWQRSTIASLAQLSSQRRKLDDLIGAQRAKLTEAERQVRLLEELRQKRHSLWKADLLREEETFASEAFLARFVRERAAGERS